MREIYFFIRNIGVQMRYQNVSAFAASTAFFFILSVVPMLIVICTIIPYTPLTQENLVMAVTELTPDVIDSLAENLISEVYHKSAGILSIAALTTLWSAGKGVMALMRGLNAINGVEDKRNYVLIQKYRPAKAKRYHFYISARFSAITALCAVSGSSSQFTSDSLTTFPGY